MTAEQRRLLNGVLMKLKAVNTHGSLVHYSDEHDGKMRDYDITLDREIESIETILRGAA